MTTAAAELLERDAELNALAAGLAGAAAGAGRGLVIEGAPGIGKTTLLRHARRMAQDAGMRVLSARGSELEHNLAFGLLRQLLLPAVREPGGSALLDGPAAAARPALGIGNTGLAADEAAVANAVYWVLSDLAEQSPVALLADDLQWADTASRRVLAHVCSRLEDLALVAVLATRPDASLAVELEPLLRDPLSVELHPAPLSVDAVRALAGSDADFAAACHEVTGGVPFLVHELLREVVAAAIAPVSESAPRVRELAPRAIQRNVLVRLSQLPPQAHAVARAVAVMPLPCTPAVAAAVASIDVEACVAAALQLTAAQVLASGAELDFAHPIMRSAVYEDIAAVERGPAHGRAAQVLIAHGAGAEEVAGHLLLTSPAGDAGTARLLYEAGHAALGAGAAAAAVRYLGRAAAEPPGPDLRCRVLADLGRAEGAAGAGGTGNLAKAHAAARDMDERADVAFDLAEALALVDGEPRAAMTVLWESIEELPERAEARLRLLAQLYVLSDRFAETLPDQERGLRSIPADLTGATPGERACLTILTHDAMVGGTAQECAAIEQRVLESGDIVADEPPGSMIAMYALTGHRIAGRLALADAMSARAAEKARLFGRRGGAAWGHLVRTTILFRRGLLVEAEAEGWLARDLLEATGPHERLPVDSWLARTLVERGKLDEAAALVDGVTAPTADQASYYLATAQAALAAARGEIERAADLQRLARGYAEPWTQLNPANDEWGHEAAMLLAAAGRLDEAREVLAGRMARAVEYGAAAPIGWLLAARGVVESDPAPLREGIAILAASEYRLAHLKAVIDLGAVLRRAGTPRDAREPLREGLAMAREAGALLSASRAEDELRAAGGRAIERALTGAESLTASELRVARLAAAGASNREIAQRLFLTVKTVEMHLGSTYRKLDIRSRKELPEGLA
jgi:DNA-binding CsgD family transcriptional regulator